MWMTRVFQTLNLSNLISHKHRRRSSSSRSNRRRRRNNNNNRNSKRFSRCSICNSSSHNPHHRRNVARTMHTLRDRWAPADWANLRLVICRRPRSSRRATILVGSLEQEEAMATAARSEGCPAIGARMVDCRLDQGSWMRPSFRLVQRRSQLWARIRRVRRERLGVALVETLRELELAPPIAPLHIPHLLLHRHRCLGPCPGVEGAEP